MTKTTSPAVVLLSGGIDSATALAMARDAGYSVHALTARYGQRHAREVDAARQVAERMGVASHRIVDLDHTLFTGSTLTTGGSTIVPTVARRAPPPTYVPARNTVLLALALAWAETLDARDIFIGANALDHAGYPDCRPEFFAAFETLANLGTREAFGGDRPWRIHAPLAKLTKASVVARGRQLGVDFRITWSCYAPSSEERPCDTCDACRQRGAAFRELGLVDPLHAQESVVATDYAT